MMDQTSHDQFKPNWNTEAVLVEEMQRMAKRVENLTKMMALNNMLKDMDDEEGT
jgi:hypothetical protein